MNIKYQEKDIALVWSFRSNIYFEQIQNKNIDFGNITANDLLILFYCVFIASLQKNKMPICSLSDFMDVVDENGGERALYNFSNWYVEQLTSQYEFLNSTEDKEKEELPDAVKKKSKRN